MEGSLIFVIYLFGVLLGFAIDNVFYYHKGWPSELVIPAILFWPIFICFILAIFPYYTIVLWLIWLKKLFDPSYNVKEEFTKRLNWLPK